MPGKRGGCTVIYFFRPSSHVSTIPRMMAKRKEASQSSVALPWKMMFHRRVTIPVATRVDTKTASAVVAVFLKFMFSFLFRFLFLLLRRAYSSAPEA